MSLSQDKCRITLRLTPVVLFFGRGCFMHFIYFLTGMMQTTLDHVLIKILNSVCTHQIVTHSYELFYPMCVHGKYVYNYEII